MTGMSLKIGGDGGGPSVQCQVSRVRISFCVTWAGMARMPPTKPASQQGFNKRYRAGVGH